MASDKSKRKATMSMGLLALHGVGFGAAGDPSADASTSLNWSGRAPTESIDLSVHQRVSSPATGALRLEIQIS